MELERNHVGKCFWTVYDLDVARITQHFYHISVSIILLRTALFSFSLVVFSSHFKWYIYSKVTDIDTLYIQHTPNWKTITPSLCRGGPGLLVTS